MFVGDNNSTFCVDSTRIYNEVNMEVEEPIDCDNCQFQDQCTRIERVFPGECQSAKRIDLKKVIK